MTGTATAVRGYTSTEYSDWHTGPRNAGPRLESRSPPVGVRAFLGAVCQSKYLVLVYPRTAVALGRARASSQFPPHAPLPHAVRGPASREGDPLLIQPRKVPRRIAVVFVRAHVEQARARLRGAERARVAPGPEGAEPGGGRLLGAVGPHETERPLAHRGRERRPIEQPRIVVGVP